MRKTVEIVNGMILRSVIGNLADSAAIVVLLIRVSLLSQFLSFRHNQGNCNSCPLNFESFQSDLATLLPDLLDVSRS